MKKDVDLHTYKGVEHVYTNGENCQTYSQKGSVLATLMKHLLRTAVAQLPLIDARGKFDGIGYQHAVVNFDETERKCSLDVNLTEHNIMVLYGRVLSTMRWPEFGSRSGID